MIEIRKIVLRVKITITVQKLDDIDKFTNVKNKMKNGIRSRFHFSDFAFFQFFISLNLHFHAFLD